MKRGVINIQSNNFEGRVTNIKGDPIARIWTNREIERLVFVVESLQAEFTLPITLPIRPTSSLAVIFDELFGVPWRETTYHTIHEYLLDDPDFCEEFAEELERLKVGFFLHFITIREYK